VSVLPIAQLPSATYTPVILLLIAYAVLSVLANRARSNDDRPRTDRFSSWAFVVVLVFAAYVVVLLIVSLFSYPSRFSDMVLIIAVIAAFFALLLSAFFVIAEVLPNALRRGRDR
jgi:O-antigen/teichoic acid export membrane protein